MNGTQNKDRVRKKKATEIHKSKKENASGNRLRIGKTG